jgi:predicted DNA-binding transcriptional regulator YafY
MSTNKNALLRYQVIDNCLRNPGRNYYIDDLLEAVNDALAEESFNDGIKRRQLFEDFLFMERNWDAPIERVRDGKRVYYRYEDLNFSISNQPLNETESNKLRETITLLSRFKGMPQFGWMEEILTKLNYGLGLKGDSDEIISFDHNEYLAGMEYFSKIYDAISYKKTIEIVYHPFTKEKGCVEVVHPYYLKQYNKRWFLICLNNNLQLISNYPLDRIEGISDSKIKYKESLKPDFTEYFEDIIGVTHKQDTELVKITIRVSPHRAPYIKTKPFHGSQKKLKEDESGFYFTIEIFPNNEFYQQVFSFGEDMEIVSPLENRNELKEKIKQLLKNYK